MHRLCLLLFTVAVATAAVTPIREDKIAGKDYLLKQKAVLQLLIHVHQPLFYPELIEIAETWKMNKMIDMYTDQKAVTQLMNMWQNDLLLKRGEIFTPLDEEHLNQAIALFDVLYFAKDWDTMYKTAVWARHNMNEGMFVYSFSIALHKRDDTKTLLLPPMYEIFPEMFIHANVIQKGYEARMKSINRVEKDLVVIPANLSTWMHTKMTPERRIAYFTEDVIVNDAHFEMHMEDPRWFLSEKYGKKDLHYELLFFKIKQLLAKYEWERLSNNLEKSKMFRWDQKMPGYAPHLRYKNGMDMSFRSDWMKLTDTLAVEVEDVMALDKQFRLMMQNHTIVLDADHRFEEVLETMREKLVNTLHRKLWSKLLKLAGQISDPMKKHDLAPGALMHWVTQLRDPLYYSFLGRMYDAYLSLKAKLPSYKKSELLLPGVLIESVEVDKLITYFEPFDVEINNALDVSSLDDDKKMTVIARTSRINHRPFNYRIMVSSEKPMPVIVRVFLGPKIDSNGIELTLDEKAVHMAELDRFKVDLKSGKNKIERNSKEIMYTKSEKLNFRALYKKIEDAIQDKAPFMIKDVKSWGIPEHQILPKGKKHGMPYTMIFTITPLTNEEKNEDSSFWLDDKPLGFPFDRKPVENEFMVPNMVEKEVIIYHKKTDEIHETI